MPSTMLLMALFGPRVYQGRDEALREIVRRLYVLLRYFPEAPRPPRMRNSVGN